MGSVGRSTNSSGWDDGASYKYFTAEPSYLRSSYGGSEEWETYRWFSENTNMKELIDKIVDEEEDKYFDDWSQGEFMDGKQYQGFSNMDEYSQWATKAFDKYLDQAKIEKPLVVVRNAGFELLGVNPATSKGILDELKELQGSLVESRGNMSCAAAKVGLNISHSQPVQYNFHIQGGPKCTGAGMYIGDDSINGWGGQQREFMMNRNTFFEVGKVRYDDDRQMYVVDMYYRGRRAEHDYS